MKLFTNSLLNIAIFMVASSILSNTRFSSTFLASAAAPPPPDPNTIYYMPSEEELHEGTWIQWPHNYGWDSRMVSRLQNSYVQMTKALHTGERVHIVVYDNRQRNQVSSLLSRQGLNMNNIDFHMWRTDDVWARDNGPIFVFDENDNLMVEDWGFNGWGNKAEYEYDDVIPRYVARALNLPLIDVSIMVNEGGSVEVDGRGTLMAKKSSILNDNRNPGWTQADAEAYFRKYLGVTNFIWLNGEAGYDITDDHIDGAARFAKDGRAIVTHWPQDFWDPAEYDILSNARNALGQKYEIIHLPMTSQTVRGMQDYGIYINYYVGNDVVLVPIFNDPNDSVAMDVLSRAYPTRTMVGIDFTALYRDGGLVHCVTQQQPAALRRGERNLRAKEEEVGAPVVDGSE